MKHENLDLREKLAKYEKIIPAELESELKLTKEKVMALTSKEAEYKTTNKCTEAEVQEKDQQIANLFQDNLVLQRCKEKTAKVIRCNDALTEQNLELICK